jgi:hypothetical protein
MREWGVRMAVCCPAFVSVDGLGIEDQALRRLAQELGMLDLHPMGFVRPLTLTFGNHWIDNATSAAFARAIGEITGSAFSTGMLTTRRDIPIRVFSGFRRLPGAS